MSLPPRTSRKAIAAFLFGLLALASGFLALFPGADLLLGGVLVCCALAVLLGLVSRRQIRRGSRKLQGKALAGWGIGLSVGSFCLAGVLLPAT